MSRICDIGLIINGGEEVKLESLGFHLIESPEKLYVPYRDYDKIEYPEYDREEVDTRAAMDSFVYEITLAFEGTIDTANSEIIKLYETLFTLDPSTGLIVPLDIELINYYKNVSISGLIQAWTGDSSYYDSKKDIVLFKMAIIIEKPEDCDFAIELPKSNVLFSVNSDGAPLTGALVSIGSKSELTDNNGEVSFDLNDGSSYNYNINKDGYESTNGSVSVQGYDQTVTVDMDVSLNEWVLLTGRWNDSGSWINSSLWKY